MDITLRNISLAFRNQSLFSDFSIDIQRGEKVWIDAPSGRGKSTLLRIIYGFQQPDSGQVLFNGQTAGNFSKNDIRGKVGYLAQAAPLPKGTLADIVQEIIAFEHNKHLGIDKNVVERSFAKFGLGNGIFHKNTRSLSGGERQRACFALLTVLEREVWLLDEITSGLDAENAQSVVDAVAQTKATVIVTAHDRRWEDVHMRKIQLHA